MFAAAREALKPPEARKGIRWQKQQQPHSKPRWSAAPRPRWSASPRRGRRSRAIIFGQTQVVEEALVTLLSGGHGLLVGVPGLAKTKLVETLGTVLGLNARRVQFTPDLMPADILGSEVLEESGDRRRSFRFVQGPIFAQLLMADEINRASPRTQSALLQAMQEYHVSIAGERHDLPQPFHVLATQNPLEQEGTYPLPEAQLDRFLMQIDVGYPDRAAERRILVETTGAAQAEAKARDDRRRADGDAAPRAPAADRRERHRGDPRRRALGASRRRRSGHHPAYRLGAGPARGAGPDAGDARARAARRPAVALDRRMSRRSPTPVLKHRMALTFSARAEGETVTDLISKLTARLG